MLSEIGEKASGSYLAVINVGSVVWRAPVSDEMGTERVMTSERGGRGEWQPTPECDTACVCRMSIREPSGEVTVS